MKIIKDENIIKRRGTIGGWLYFVAFVVLIIAFILNTRNISTQSAEQRNENSLWVLITFVAGIILLQIGIYMTGRWGRLLRPDEKLDAALKGLPNDYSIYHFKTPAPHLLVGPAGIWVLLPYRMAGLLSYARNRWVVSKRSFSQWYMSIMGQEGIGRPDWDAENEINAIRKLLGKSLGENEIPTVQAMLVFTNERIEIDAEGTPLPALKLKQLKDFIRQKAKERPINQTQLAAVKAALPE